MLSKETQEYREYTHNCSMLNCRKYPKYDTGCNVQQVKQISGWIALSFLFTRICKNMNLNEYPQSIYKLVNILSIDQMFTTSGGHKHR